MSLFFPLVMVMGLFCLMSLLLFPNGPHTDMRFPPLSSASPREASFSWNGVLWLPAIPCKLAPQTSPPVSGYRIGCFNRRTLATSTLSAHRHIGLLLLLFVVRACDAW
jgi:hypothetical protein